MPGTLFVVATPIGNLDDITARALNVLREATVIAAEDTRRTARLLARYAIATPTTSLHEHNEHQKAASLIARLRAGDSVALVSDAGTPTVSDPGSHLIAEAVSAGIQVVTIPGPNAAVAALAVSGFPTSSFTFLGFPPNRSKDRTTWFADLRRHGGTVIFYEAPHRILETLSELKDAVGDCEVVIGRELTKVHEELVRGPISVVLKAPLKRLGEFTVVANIGYMANYIGQAEPGPTDIAAEVGLITKQATISKRQAISIVARKLHLRPNQVYAAFENAKK